MDANERDLPTADLMTATSVAALMGVSVSTLVKWLDAGDKLKAAPPAILQGGGRYVFRPSVVAPWLESRGYFVPAPLYERAKKESERAA